jgi:ATP-dependent Lhr-like helicase
MVPFWKAEDLNRDFHVASAVGGFLEKANGRLGDPDFMEWLEGEHGLDPVSSENLVRFLSWQRSASGCDLPSRHHVLVEEIGPGADADPGHRPVPAQLVIHTFFGGRVNKPLALALCAAWERRHGSALEYFAGNECLVIQLPDAGGGADALWEIMAAEVNSGTVEALLRHKMESTGLFGARFRENAARSLLLPRGNARKRVPLWMTRMRARKLLDAVASSTDFPVLVETWRDCLEDEFDLASLKLVLDELARGEIRISRRSGREPSPFAADLVWRQINHDMYQDDTPAPGRGSALGDDLFRELLGEERLRPAVPEDLATAFAAKLQGTMPEYRPDTPGELVAVLCEHGFMPAKLWDELCCYSSRGAALDPAFDEDLTRLSRLFARFRPPGAATDWIVAVPQLPSILSGMGLWRTAMPVEFSQEVAQWLQEHPDPDPPVQPERLLLRWLERQGPVLLSRIVWMFGWSEDRCLALLQALILDELVVSGRLVEGSDALRFCEAQNYERLLRLHRTSRREGVAILPVDRLPLFLGAWHGLVAPVANPDLPALQEVLDRCMAYPLPAALWEEVVLPCRLRPYQPALLDSLFANYGLIWQGNGEGRVFLALNDEAPLYAPAPVAPEAAPPAGSDDARVLAALGAALPAGAGLGLLELARSLGLDSGRANDALWSLAWQGRVTADSFETLRRGIRNGFTAGEATAGRGGFRRWESTRATVGRWRRFVAESSGLDAVDRLEGSRELVSQLLRRHGVVFREILANELPQLQWTAVIRVLRLMELSGEVLAGRFFEGIPGIQFASPEAARRLAAWDFNAPAWAETVWWVNAQDPASLCGLGVPMAPPAPPEGSGATPATAAGLELPRRVASNWLVYAGSRLVMVVRRQGRELDIDLPGDDALLGRVLAFFPFLLSRSLETGPAVVVETINGQPAAAVPHAAGFRQAGFLADHHGLSLWKRY